MSNKTSFKYGRRNAEGEISLACEELPSGLEGKLEHCAGLIKGLGRVVVAFSGGVDSSFLLAFAAEVLGRDNVLAVMSVSASQPRRARRDGRSLAERLGVEMVEVETAEFSDSAYRSNPPRRCYHCKRHLFEALWVLARQRGFQAVAAGSNADDSGDYRPGLEAAREQGVSEPLMEAGLTKQDVRDASRAMGLETWSKPASACLASRVPYGSEITPDRLGRIERSEEILADMGFCRCRVRDHDGLARVEVPPESLERALEHRERIVRSLISTGFTYVTLDLQGLRSGSMNAALSRTTDAPADGGGA
ncbi:MAG: ATP-dependent sacrificial sulfur transferase LarE [Phycisphaerae bacterium]